MDKKYVSNGKINAIESPIPKLYLEFQTLGKMENPLSASEKLKLQSPEESGWKINQERNTTNMSADARNKIFFTFDDILFVIIQ